MQTPLQSGGALRSSTNGTRHASVNDRNIIWYGNRVEQQHTKIEIYNIDKNKWESIWAEYRFYTEILANNAKHEHMQLDVMNETNPVINLGRQARVTRNAIKT